VTEYRGPIYVVHSSIRRSFASNDSPISHPRSEYVKGFDRRGLARGSGIMRCRAPHLDINITTCMPTEKITAWCENIRDRVPRRESMINKSNRRARQIGMIVICWDFTCACMYKRPKGWRGEENEDGRW